jgi:hypothetical protein
VLDEPALIHEARRIYLRYAQEVVEALGLCPWAAQARRDGRVRKRVLTSVQPALVEILAAVEAVESDADAEIGLLIFPQLRSSRVEFQRLAASVREADAAHKGRDKTLMALADFHPDAEPDMRSPERLIGFVRRSPDPTLQLVRRSALAAVRMTQDSGTRFVDASTLKALSPDELPHEPEPLARRIARHNHQTIAQLGVESVRARFDDIANDRDASYARLGVPPPPWSARPADPRPLGWGT